MLDLAFHDGAEEHHRVQHPDHGDQQVDRPFQLGVFLGRGQAQGQGHGRSHDHQLPAPESGCRQLVGYQARLAGSLHHVIGGRKQCGAPEREDNRIGMQWPQSSKAGPGEVKIQRRPGQLSCKQDPHQHADDAPHHGHDCELAHDLVVVGRVLQRRVELAHGSVPVE